jgi:thiamine phosphate synthase YjbQ (UPF0047 family)
VDVGSAELRFSTRGDSDVVDITTQVQRVVDEAGVAEGQASVFVRGSTAAITTMEYEPGGSTSTIARGSGPWSSRSSAKRKRAP